MTPRVCLGAFAGAYGVKGATKVRSFTEREEGVAAYGPVESEDGKRRFTLSIIRALKPGLVVAAAPEIESREDAAALAGVRFYVLRSALPPAGDCDDFYMEDLVGLKVVSGAGADLGRIAGVHNFGAGDILEIAGRPGAAGSIFAPFTKAFFPAVDLGRGIAVAAPEAFGAMEEPDAAGLVDEAMRQEDA